MLFNEINNYCINHKQVTSKKGNVEIPEWDMNTHVTT